MVLLVRYGELSLKSPYVRRQLEDRLVANVQDMFAAGRVECVVKRERGRVFVHAEDEATAIRLLRRVFGIVSISPAKEATSALEPLAAFVAGYARDVLTPGMSFAIRARRSGQHPYNSQDLARVLGQAVRNAVPGAVVDLDAPDRELQVEVRGPRAYVFHEVVDGPGGLPLGSQGHVLAVAVDEAGMAATWLAMRRGCRARVAGRDSFLAVLRRWDPRLATLDPIPVLTLVRLAAEKREPLVLPTDEGLASGDDTPFVLRPLAGFTGDEVANLSRRIRES